MRQRSKKMIATYRERRKLVKRLLEERPRCQIQWDESCTGRSVDLHELKKRSRGGSILDESNIVTTCRSCHQATELFPEEALRRGWLVSSWDDTNG